MELNAAFRQMIKAYWKDKDFEKAESFKNKKYNKKYFDELKEEFLGEKSEEKLEGKEKNGKLSKRPYSRS